MALSEIQKNWLTQPTFYTQLMNIASGMDNNFLQWRNKLEWLNLVTSADLTTMGIPSETQTLLANFRTALTSVITEYDASMAAIADEIRVL